MSKSTTLRRFSTSILTQVKRLVLYEDNHIIVVNKPATLPTQSDNTKDLNLLDLVKNYIAQKYNKPGAAYIGLVHRIDRPCSGVVVFARTSKSASRLSKSFSERDVDKRYVCMVHGMINRPGVCHNYLRQSPAYDNSNKVTVVPMTESTKPSSAIDRRLVEAKLAYSPLFTFNFNHGKNSIDGRTVLEVELYTGRKHQIRAQLSHIGHPICGDAKYGAPLLLRNAASPNQSTDKAHGFVALHAHSLKLKHPTTKETLTFTAEVPEQWRQLCGADTFQKLKSALKESVDRRAIYVRKGTKG